MTHGCDVKAPNDVLRWVSNMRNGFLSCIAYLFLIFSSTLLAEPQSAQQKILTVADIHFDPFIGCEKGKYCHLIQELDKTPSTQWKNILHRYDANMPLKYNQDTSYRLLTTTLNEIQRVNENEHPFFALVIGDFLGHKYRRNYKEYTGNKSPAAYQAFVNKTFQFLTDEIQNALPNINVYPVIGNHDSYTGNYHVVPDGAFLQDTQNTWAHFIINDKNKKRFLQTFHHAGYYEVQLSDQNRLIVLNTVLFSNRAHSAVMKQAALEQVAWLHTRLSIAQQQHQRVILSYHIPVGIDIFATIKHNLSIQPFWKPEYYELFNKEIQQFAPIIALILPAHTHTDTFQFIAIKQLANIPIVMTPSISPIFGNDPEFKVMTVDSLTLQIKQIQEYTYPLSRSTLEWKQTIGMNVLMDKNRGWTTT